MDIPALPVGPFAALTFVAAPALLTNASSVLAMSTINRMLRTRDAMRELYTQSERSDQDEKDSLHLLETVNRVERQGVLLLRALHAIYVALAAFASATLVTLLGTGLAPFAGGHWPHAFAIFGIMLGFVGVGGLVTGSFNLFRATQLSLVNIREEAAIIRERRAERNAARAKR